MEIDLNYVADAGAGFLVSMTYTAAAICVIARGPIIARYAFKKYGGADKAFDYGIYYIGALVYALAFGAPTYLAVYSLSPLEALQTKSHVFDVWSINGIASGAALAGILIFLIDANSTE